MLRSQSDINEKLYQYVCLNRPHEFFLDRLAQQGYCYSFSLIYAAMQIIGKLDWWLETLDHILSWDGLPESLNSYVLDENNNFIKLDDLFKKVLNFVLFNQASNSAFPYTNNNQYSFLLPGGMFMLLNERDEIITIKQNHTIAGHFSAEDLGKILKDEPTQNAIQHNICLVHSRDHTCSLSYTGTQWELLDPNYNCGQAITFNSSDHLVAEIFSILGKDIAIELACINELNTMPFPYYYQILHTQPENLIQNKGLLIIAQNNLTLIPILFNQLKQRKKLKNVNINQTYLVDQEPLILAATHGHAQAIQALCEAGADPNQADQDGTTPLMSAAKYGHPQAIQALYKAGVDPNQADQNSNTLLMDVARIGHVCAIQALCQAGAAINQTNKNGWTALIFAAKYGHTPVIHELCQAGADPNVASPQGTTALRMTVQHGYVKATLELLRQKANASLIFKETIKILVGFAKKNGREKEFSLFLEQHAHLQHADTIDFTSFHIATFYGHLSVLSILLKHQSNCSIPLLKELYTLAKSMGHSAIMNMLQQRINEISSSQKAAVSGQSLFKKRKASDLKQNATYSQQSAKKAKKEENLNSPSQKNNKRKSTYRRTKKNISAVQPTKKVKVSKENKSEKHSYLQRPGGLSV